MKAPTHASLAFNVSMALKTVNFCVQWCSTGWSSIRWLTLCSLWDGKQIFFRWCRTSHRTDCEESFPIKLHFLMHFFQFEGWVNLEWEHFQRANNAIQYSECAGCHLVLPKIHCAANSADNCIYVTWVPLYYFFGSQKCLNRNLVRSCVWMHEGHSHDQRRIDKSTSISRKPIFRLHPWFRYALKISNVWIVLENAICENWAMATPAPMKHTFA